MDQSLCMALLFRIEISKIAESAFYLFFPWTPSPILILLNTSSGAKSVRGMRPSALIWNSQNCSQCFYIYLDCEQKCRILMLCDNMNRIYLQEAGFPLWNIQNFKNLISGFVSKIKVNFFPINQKNFHRYFKIECRMTEVCIW